MLLMSFSEYVTRVSYFRNGYDMVDDEKAVTILTGNEVECAEPFGYDDDLARAGARASPKNCGPSLLVAEHAGLQP